MFAFCQCLLSIALICRQITCDLYQQVEIFLKIKTKQKQMRGSLSLLLFCTSKRGMMIFQLLLRVIQVVFVQESVS